MHHYGEDAVKVTLTPDEFKIVLTNHHTGAKIVVTGPVQGVLEKKGQRITKRLAERLGDEFAHLARRILVREEEMGL